MKDTMVCNKHICQENKKYTILEKKDDFLKFISINFAKDTGGFEIGICGSVAQYLIHWDKQICKQIDSYKYLHKTVESPSCDVVS